jgi:hypothetical protein
MRSIFDFPAENAKIEDWVAERSRFELSGDFVDQNPVILEPCVWRIADFPQKSAIRHTQDASCVLRETIWIRRSVLGRASSFQLIRFLRLGSIGF